jgi:hypothetical protein
MVRYESSQKELGAYRESIPPESSLRLFFDLLHRYVKNRGHMLFVKMIELNRY